MPSGLPDSTTTTYGYNELGQQTAQTDGNGHTTRFQYDDLGRRSGRFLPSDPMVDVTLAVAPLPSVTIAITAATPMMMPSVVRAARIRFRRNSRTASISAFSITTAPTPE